MATAISQYATGTTRERIEQALRQAGVDLDRLVPGDLTPIEHFHTLGLPETRRLVELAAVTAEDRVLDAGGSIGGTARFLAEEIGCHVTSVDLTPEYCEVARWLNAAVGLDRLIEVREADVLELPFAGASFDVLISQHVQMNIADKAHLYQEARRVLAPGGRLALWDVTAGPNQPLSFPVPWAAGPEHSHLVGPDELRALVTGAGFEVAAWNDLTERAAQTMQALLSGAPQQLGLGVFVPDFATKVRNLADNLAHDRVRLIQAVLRAV